MDPLLDLILSEARLDHAAIARRLGVPTEQISQRLADLEAAGTIVGYQAVINPELAGDSEVSAFIEVRLTPERGGGFDRLANRIARFDQVRSCYLASGGFDLLVIVHAPNLREVARFVSEKLSTLEGVLSTATHFQLKTYKQNGFLFDKPEEDQRLAVAP